MDSPAGVAVEVDFLVDDLKSKSDFGFKNDNDVI